MDSAVASRSSQGLQQHTELAMQQHLLPIQVRFVRLLEMNQQEAEAAVERELDVNPALTVEDEETPGLLHPAFRPQTTGYVSPSDDYVPAWARQADDSVSLYDYLNEQLNEIELPPEFKKVCQYVIGSLDANGYLQRSAASMVDDLAFGPGIEVSTEEMHRAIEVVQSLDPAGIAASDLRESLLLQLRRMPHTITNQNALRIIEDCFEPFSKKHYHRIISQLKLTTEELDEAIGVITSLNPKPGSVIGTGRSDMAHAIVPDFQIDVGSDGELTVSIPSALPDLAISAGFESAVKMLESNRAVRENADRNFILSRYNDARDFIEVLERRRTTLFSVMTAITAHQRNYLLTGDEQDMRPLTLREIAAVTGYDVSTVSRATAGKYAATPYGVVPLRFFFSEGYSSGEGDHHSARAIMAALRTIVNGEDKKHPLSDDKICEELRKQNYEVSRRTVAKYRDRLGIPVARLRK